MMKDNLEIIDQKVKEAFDKYHPKPNESIWEGIKNNIPSKSSILSNALNLKNITIILSSVIVITSIIYFSNRNNNKLSENKNITDLIPQTNLNNIQRPAEKDNQIGTLSSENQTQFSSTSNDDQSIIPQENIDSRNETILQNHTNKSTSDKSSIESKPKINNSSQANFDNTDNSTANKITEPIKLPKSKLDKAPNTYSSPINSDNIDNILKPERTVKNRESLFAKKGTYTFFNQQINEQKTFCDSLSLGFTPNGDGINDVWRIPNILEHRPINITIGNRMGQIIYSSNDYTNNWGGTYRGASLPEGTYYYFLITKNNVECKGSINIIK